jgi:hypothetical protein
MLCVSKQPLQKKISFIDIFEVKDDYEVEMATDEITEGDLDLILKTVDVYEFPWMKIFNSKIKLSNEFIIRYNKFIVWKDLERPLDENLIQIFKYRINWKYQIAEEIPRKFEFMCEYKSKFDWEYISKNIPSWFNDLHYDWFGDVLMWEHMTYKYKSMSNYIIMRYAEKLDWKWITENDIRGEAFCIRFMDLIEWNNENIDTTNISPSVLEDHRSIHNMN